jgi:type IV secretory pathway TrbF-like protein
MAVAQLLLSPSAVSDSNPYVEARREWNDRYLDLVGERRVWQAVAGRTLSGK